MQLAQAPFLREAQLDRIVRVIEHEALDDVRGRPGREVQRRVVVADRTRADASRAVSIGRPIHRFERAQATQHCAAMAGIDDHADALGLADRRAPRRSTAVAIRSLKRAMRRARRAALVRELFELAAMIERQHVELTARTATHRGRVMQVFEAIVEVGPRHGRRRAPGIRRARRGSASPACSRDGSRRARRRHCRVAALSTSVRP